MRNFLVKWIFQEKSGGKGAEKSGGKGAEFADCFQRNMCTQRILWGICRLQVFSYEVYKKIAAQAKE